MQAIDKECVFCKIVAGKIPDYRVWEDDKFIAFLDLRPFSDGHTLVVPKEHYEYVFDMPLPKYGDLFTAARQVAPAIAKVTKAPRVGMVVEGFGVPHVHLHLVPIYHGNELDPHRAHQVSEEFLVEMQGKLKAALS